MEVVLSDLYKQVGKDLGISASRVQRIYWLYWKQIKQYMESLPLKDVDSLDGLQTNITLHKLGKFWCDPFDFNKLKKYYHKKNDTEEN